ncbi:CAAX prenyl protease-like protein [Haloferula luteola]|uniref:CAAX prenyl protease-like protein n=1 Tax=Haloferula luteola TaxID=595692 RepID=A0A840UXS0_9BACT|nr:CAAX prenyl protease-related protein [Haloferula luteola]MBB5350525.1 CAAX prenyl protease-like protein [Haloferula luteola]
MMATPESPAEPLRWNQPDRWIRRQVIPFAVFMGFLLVLQLAGSFFASDLPSAPWWRKSPEQWIYPIQSVACLVLLGRWWRSYEFHWNLRWSLIGAIFGAVGIGFWLLPTVIWDHWQPQGEGWWTGLGVEDRKGGFDPGDYFAVHSPAWFLSLAFRFLRAVVVVALVEEIFWRSFLMRLVSDWNGPYWKQPFGRHSWLAFGVVTAGFVLAHAPVDYSGAIIYGSLTYLLTVWSKNLGACVIMHAVANGLMGIFILYTGKTGLW